MVICAAVLLTARWRKAADAAMALAGYSRCPECGCAAGRILSYARHANVRFRRCRPAPTGKVAISMEMSWMDK